MTLCSETKIVTQQKSSSSTGCKKKRSKLLVLAGGVLLAACLIAFLNDPQRWLPIRISFDDTAAGSHHPSARLQSSTAPQHSSSTPRYDEEHEDTWDPTDVQHIGSRFCNIERRSMWSLTREAFEATYLEKTPVIIVIDVDLELERHELFQSLTSRVSMLRRFSNYSITLSSANRNSYAKRNVPLHQYLQRDLYMAPQPLERRGEDTWYMFGDQNPEEWKVLFDHYPTLKQYIFGKYVSLSFGIGPSGSGVPFHTHGHVFNEVLHGEKRWWLQRPNAEDPNDHSPDDGPVQDPQASTLQWLANVRPSYSQKAADALWECTVKAGEVLYIPSQWHHATLNIGETVFMAAFV